MERQWRMKADPPQSKNIFDDLPSVVGIIGGREFNNEHWVREFVSRIKPNTLIVSGGARGVDSWAVNEAEKHNLPTKVFEVTGNERRFLWVNENELTRWKTRWMRFLDGSRILKRVCRI